MSRRTASARAAFCPRAVVTLAVLVLFGWGVVRVGSARHPVGPSHGARLLPPDTPPAPEALRRPPGELTVATWNLRRGKGDPASRDGRSGRNANETTFARLLGRIDPDVVALQEVDGTGFNQARRLANALGAGWVFAPTQRRWGRQDVGNALLSRRAVTGWQAIPLAYADRRAPRNAILAAVDVGGMRVNVLAVHLGRGTDRAEHVRVATALFSSLAEPAVLLGDLNATTDEPTLAALLDRPGVFAAVPPTTPADAARRVDWVIVRGVSIADAGVVQTPASDHPLVWATLRPTAGESRTAPTSPQATSPQATSPQASPPQASPPPLHFSRGEDG